MPDWTAGDLVWRTKHADDQTDNPVARNENKSSLEADIEEEEGGDNGDGTEELNTRPLSQMLCTLDSSFKATRRTRNISQLEKKKVKTLGQIWERLFKNKYFEELTVYPTGVDPKLAEPLSKEVRKYAEWAQFEETATWQIHGKTNLVHTSSRCY